MEYNKHAWPMIKEDRACLGISYPSTSLRIWVWYLKRKLSQTHSSINKGRIDQGFYSNQSRIRRGLVTRVDRGEIRVGAMLRDTDKCSSYALGFGFVDAQMDSGYYSLE